MNILDHMKVHIFENDCSSLYSY